MTWSAAALGDLCKIVSGATPKTGEAQFWGGEVPWATPKDLSRLDTEFLDWPERSITQDGLRSCAASILPQNSVLLSSRAPIGLVAINTRPMATNQGFKSLVPDSQKLNSKFLFHWLKANKNHLQSLGNGATFKEISKAVVERIEIPLPPLDEQRRIAAILDKADALRRKRKRALDLLDGLHSAVIEDVVKPEHNQNIELRECLSFVTSGGRGWSQYYSNAGCRFIRSLDVKANAISDEEMAFVQPPDNAEARRTKIESGDVLLTITGSRIGRVAAIDENHSGSYISQHVAILRPDKSKLNPYFLSCFLNSTAGQCQIAKWQYGQTKPGLNFDQIRSFNIPDISRDQQNRVVAKMRELAAKRALGGGQKAVFDDLFTSLQSRAFSGQL